MKKISSVVIIIIFSVIRLHAQCDISGTLTVCVGSTTQLLGTGTPATINPWISASPDVAIVNAAGLVTGVNAGTSIITYTSTSCSSIVTVTVTDLVTPLFTTLGPYCVGATPGTLPEISINDITGTWSPANVSTTSAGISTYIFTPTEGQCATTISMDISVNASLAPTFTAPGPYCIGATIPALPTTSINGITGTWSPIINNTVTTLYTFTPTAGQCAATTTLTITINPNDILPTFTAVGPYCAGATIPELPAISINGITGAWSPAINNTATTLYTFAPTEGQCAATTTMTINITPNTTPAFDGVGPYCSGATIPALPITSTNGITGTWSPAINNTATTLYTFTPTAGQCAATTTLTITISPNTIPTFAGVGPYCSGSTVPALPTTSTNGITGTWSPAINNTATTLYTFTPTSGQCITTTTLTVVINPVLSPVFATVRTYCSGEAVPALPTTSTNGVSGTWSPAINNTATTLYTFTPTSGQCATTTTLTITISPNTIPTFSGVGPYCSGSTVPALPTTSTNRITGTWSPAINNTATTLYTFTPTAGQCAATTTMTINITPNTTPVFAGVGPYCSGAAIPALPTTSTNGITGTWSPAINNTATTLYTFAPTSGECITTTTLTIVINPVITPAFNSVGPYCTGAAIPALPTISTNGITGTWSPAINNTATTLYTFTPTAGQCAATATMTITITPNTIPAFAGIGPYCSGASVPALPTTSTNGITGTWSPAINNTATTLYNFTPTAGQCATSATLTVTIIASPSAPSVGTITHPTCEVGTGSVILSGLPSSGTWTLTRTPGGTSTTGSGSSTTLTGIPSGTFTFTVANSSGCISSASGSVVINTNPSTPTSPTVGRITQPTCSLETGSAVLSGLPASGTWILTRTPGGTTTAGTGISTTISGLTANTYTFTVTNESGCPSTSSGNVVINEQPTTPNAPAAGTIIQPTCTVATGSVVLNGLPGTGTWTITRTPGGTTISGSGTSTIISDLTTGTHAFTITNASGCTSPVSANIVINTQPSTPTAPAVGAITDPTCTVSTGSAVLNGLPEAGTWTLTRTPGANTSTGTGTSATISGIPAGTFNFTVTNAVGCISSGSVNAVINAQPTTPTAPVIGTITQPSLSVPTGRVILSGLPAMGDWTLTATPGSIITAGKGLSTTISGLAPGIYTFTVTNASGCTSLASAAVGLFTLKLYGPDQKILRSNDTVKTGNSDAGSISLSVESNTDWTVSENSLWLKAVKESGSSKITVSYLENISSVNKVAAIKVAYTSNPELVINFKQKARVSQLNESKFDYVKVYPNPAKDFVYLNFVRGEYEKVFISMTNMQGFIISKEEYSNITSGQIIGLIVSTLPAGHYLISVGDGIYSKSFQMIKN